MEELISILLCTYNRAALLREALGSIFRQTYSNWELIIVDDGSEDETQQMVTSFMATDNRIKYFRHEKNKGCPASRLTAFSAAKGKYITMLDSDDKYLPDALESLLSTIKQQPESVKLVYGDHFLQRENERTLNYVSVVQPEPKPALFLQLQCINPVLPSACIADRKAIEEVGGYDPTCQTSSEFDLWLRLLKKYELAKVDKPIVIYKKHTDQITSNIGLMRYNRDKTLYHFFKSFHLNDLFPGVDSHKKLAVKLEGHAARILTNRYPPFDTALMVLRLAQLANFTQKREKLITQADKEVTILLKNHYKYETRLPEKWRYPTELY